jgi:hypothetical protein
MAELQKLLVNDFECLHISNYDATSHPGVLFVGVQYQLSILLGKKQSAKKKSDIEVFSTVAMRWAAEERPGLFDRLRYSKGEYKNLLHSFPKFGMDIESVVWKKYSLTNTQIIC